MKCKIKKNDLVYVEAGKDKGAKGRVLAVYPDKGTALVEHINMVRKHRKAQKQGDEKGIVSREAPIAISNLRCIDGKTGEPTRVKIRSNEDGTRERVSAEGNPIQTAR